MKVVFFKKKILTTCSSGLSVTFAAHCWVSTRKYAPHVWPHRFTSPASTIPVWGGFHLHIQAPKHVLSNLPTSVRWFLEISLGLIACSEEGSFYLQSEPRCLLHYSGLLKRAHRVQPLSLPLDQGKRCLIRLPRLLSPNPGTNELFKTLQPFCW